MGLNMGKKDVPCVSMHIGSYTSELTELDIFWPKVSDLFAGSGVGVHLHVFLESGYSVCQQYHVLDRLILWGAMHILWIVEQNNRIISKMELGFHLSVIWGIIWMSHRCHLGVIWDNLDITCHYLEIAWTTIGNYMDNLAALGCQKDATFVPLGCHFFVIWTSFGCHLGAA